MKRFLPIFLIVATLTLSSCGALRNPVGTASRMVKSAPYQAQGLANGLKGTARSAAFSAKHLTNSVASGAAQTATVVAPVATTIATGGL